MHAPVEENRPRRHPSPRRSALLASTFVYATVVVAWQLLRLTPATHWWWFQLVDALAVWSYLPILLLACCSLLTREWRASLPLLAPALLFWVEYGALFLPNGRSQAGTPVRVMTANLLQSNANYDSLAAALAHHQPDLVALQELGTSMAARARTGLADHYPYQALDPSDSTFGMGILSRHPMRAPPSPAMGYDSCQCQQASLEVQSRSVVVFNAHPIAPFIPTSRLGRFPMPADFQAEGHERTVETILERASSIQQPLLLMGDFNVTERQPTYRRIRQRLRDAHYEAGWGLGLTFPARLWRFSDFPMFPLLRIDYIFHDDSWSVNRVWTGDLAGSDHRYVVADLVLR
jgi:vancomycin resistance protein VanJ